MPSRPFPLSARDRAALFSLSDECDAVEFGDDDGDVSRGALLADRRGVGFGDASHTSPLYVGAGDFDGTSRAMEDGLMWNFRECWGRNAGFPPLLHFG